MWYVVKRGTRYEWFFGAYLTREDAEKEAADLDALRGERFETLLDVDWHADPELLRGLGQGHR